MSRDLANSVAMPGCGSRSCWFSHTHTSTSARARGWEGLFGQVRSPHLPNADRGHCCRSSARLKGFISFSSQVSTLRLLLSDAARAPHNTASGMVILNGRCPVIAYPLSPYSPKLRSTHGRYEQRSANAKCWPVGALVLRTA